MRTKKTSITTLAEVTGLSLATVSRALAGSASVTDATRAKVLEAAEKLHYVRDQAAVRLKTGKTHALAFVMDRQDAVQPGFQDFLLGLSDALRDTDYHLIVLPQPTDGDALETVHFAVRQGLCDGFVLSYTSPQDTRVAFLQEKGIPFVTYGRTALPEHDDVDFDNYAFSGMAVTALAARNRGRLGIMLPAASASFYGHLADGFSQACKQKKVAGTLLEAISLDDTPHRIYDWALNNLKQFDGLVITREAPLLPVLGAMQALGLVCGKDIDLVIKHSSQLPRYVREPLLACFEDMHLAGLTLARCMLERFEQPKHSVTRPHSHILFSPPALETTHDVH